jgi:hypothetical protein
VIQLSLADISDRYGLVFNNYDLIEWGEETEKPLDLDTVQVVISKFQEAVSDLLPDD